MGFFELGTVFLFHSHLRRIIRPHIEEMARELNVVASWSILKNYKVIIMDRIQNLNIDLFVRRIGLNEYIHATSMGKVLLAYLPDEKQDGVLQSIPLIKFTDSTIVDPKLIKGELRLIRERGYATGEGERHEDLNGMAAPIWNSKEEVIAAIHLMDEKSRTSGEKLFQFADYLKEKALFISRQLGYRASI